MAFITIKLARKCEDCGEVETIHFLHSTYKESCPSYAREKARQLELTRCPHCSKLPGDSTNG